MIGDGGQIVCDLCILFLGSGALDGDGVLGREDHNIEMGVVGLGLGLCRGEDGARLDDSASARRFALLENLLGREGFDDAAVAKCREAAEEGEEFVDPAGVVAALRSCCCEGESMLWLWLWLRLMQSS